MNSHSSRSHAIFTITIECAERGKDGQQHWRVGKLHLVDLAVSSIFISNLLYQLLHETDDIVRRL